MKIKSSKNVMIAKKYVLVFVGVVLASLLGGILSVYAAWGNGGNEAPYQGNYTYWHNSGGTGAGSLTSYAYNMKWTQSSINDMKWDGNSEWLDQTADCTQDSPGGDRLHVTGSSTNIPNYGFSTMNDCGSSSWKEESELQINPYSLNTTTNYWQSVNWDCVYGGASGDLNISFEPAWWAHEWLDKVNYWCYGGSQATNDDGTNHKPDGLVEKSKPETLREVDNGIFSYQVIRNSQGVLRVYSDVDFLDKKVFERYQKENDLQLSDALEDTKGISKLVVVTFSDPISIDEARFLIQETKMDVVSYGTFGHIGNEIVSTYMFPQSRSLEDFTQEEKRLNDVGEVVYDGIMTITGFVSDERLQILHKHKNISLLDLTANSIQAELSDLEEKIELEQIVIPNPAWFLYTGELTKAK